MPTEKSFKEHFHMPGAREIRYDIVRLMAGGTGIVIPIAAILRRQMRFVPFVDAAPADIVAKLSFYSACADHGPMFISLPRGWNTVEIISNTVYYGEKKMSTKHCK